MCLRCTFYINISGPKRTTVKDKKLQQFFVLEKHQRRQASQTYKFLLATELESNNLTRNDAVFGTSDKAFERIQGATFSESLKLTLKGMMDIELNYDEVVFEI